MHSLFSSTTTALRRPAAIALTGAVLLTGRITCAGDHVHGALGNHAHAVYGARAHGSFGWHPFQGTTWQASVLHGCSDLLRSAGQRELLHYEALRSREAAVEHALENSVRRLEVRQQRQLMGLQHRETQRRAERARRAASPATTESEPVDEAADAERRAANKLHLARGLLAAGRHTAADRYLEDIIHDFAGTAAAKEAGLLLAGR